MFQVRGRTELQEQYNGTDVKNDIIIQNVGKRSVGFEVFRRDFLRFNFPHNSSYKNFCRKRQLPKKFLAALSQTSVEKAQ